MTEKLPPLLFYNTAGRTKETFTPSSARVGLYCCGPTVYNFAHIGNLRTYLFEDILRRTLERWGFPVSHVVNITDVGHLTSDQDSGEDKMEKGARREGRSVWDIAAYYTSVFKKHIARLAIVEPTHWPRATDHIAEMVEMVARLVEKDFTYTTADGIYFDTSRFPAYGDFATIDPRQLRAGERVDMGEKRSPMDFALWKFSPRDVKRQMEWESPWGTGFPGWHIECSAMSLKYLTQPLDLHCGGIDHIRVHHSNEIAQVEAATGKKYVRYWMHGEFLVLDKGKMAKSGENFITLDTLTKRGHEPLAYRLFCFSAHYRTPLMFSWEGIASAEQALMNLRREVAALQNEGSPPGDARAAETLVQPFLQAVADDLNMPQALAVVWGIVRNKEIAPSTRLAALRDVDQILGLDLERSGRDRIEKREIFMKGEKVLFINTGERDTARLEELARIAVERRSARASKDFSRADVLRERLQEAGLAVRDLPDGATECRFEAAR